jgi:hypothetical protein
MSKGIRYIIVKAATPVELADRINVYIAAGYALDFIGRPFAVDGKGIGDTKTRVWYQAAEMWHQPVDESLTYEVEYLEDLPDAELLQT